MTYFSTSFYSQSYADITFNRIQWANNNWEPIQIWLGVYKVQYDVSPLHTFASAPVALCEGNPLVVTIAHPHPPLNTKGPVMQMLLIFKLTPKNFAKGLSKFFYCYIP